MKVPLEVSKKMLSFYDNIEFVIIHGNPNCISDIAVAALQAQAAIEGSIMNVRINLNEISDNQLVEEIRNQCKRILEQSLTKSKAIKDYIESKL